MAYAFVVYLILVVFFAHNFWDMQGAARGANMAHFYKNFAIDQASRAAKGSGGFDPFA